MPLFFRFHFLIKQHMKKSKLVFSIIACLAVSNSFCQTADNSLSDNVKKKKLKVADAAITPGVVFYNSALGAFADFQRLNPNSVLLGEDMQGYTASRGFMGSAGPSFGANLGFKILNKEKKEYKPNTQLRVGITFSEITISNYLYKTDRKRADTLTSSQTGQVVYSDSVTHSSYNMNYKNQQLRVDVSVVYRTNPAARWSFFGGIGIEAGETILAFTDIGFSKYSKLESSTNNSSSSNYNNEPYRTERIINKNGYGYSPYLPMGVDFRVGTKREFFKQLHFFYEARPFLNYTYIPELGGITNVGIKSGIGLRVTI
jgi:hypothetical protein